MDWNADKCKGLDLICFDEKVAVSVNEADSGCKKELTRADTGNRA